MAYHTEADEKKRGAAEEITGSFAHIIEKLARLEIDLPSDQVEYVVTAKVALTTLYRKRRGA